MPVVMLPANVGRPFKVYRLIKVRMQNVKRRCVWTNGNGLYTKYHDPAVYRRPAEVNTWIRLLQLPASTKESDAMSKDLKMRGFKFVRPTICYAFMQAVGMVNDHTMNCFRHRAVSKMR